MDHPQHIVMLTPCLVMLMSESPAFYHGETDSIQPKADYQKLMGRTVTDDIKTCMGHLRRHVAALEAR